VITHNAGGLTKKARLQPGREKGICESCFMDSNRTPTKFKSVSRAHPCALCGGIDGCSTGADGLILCRRRQGDEVGFICLGPAKGDPQWTTYRREIRDETPTR